jgi:two-component system cell cycle response regulator
MELLDSRSRVLGLIFGAMLLGIALHAGHAAVGIGGGSLDDFFKNDVYTAIELLALAACVARVVVRREDRLAWALIAAGLLLWTGGDLVWTVWLNNVENPPYPSVADGLYLGMYPAMYAGLRLLIRSHFRQAGAAAWIVGLVVGLAIAAVGAALIFPAINDADSGKTDAIVVNLAYLLSDLLLLVFAAVAFAVSSWRPGRQWWLLAAGLLVMACADLIFLYEEAKGRYVAGRILDTMWPTAMALIALAAWQRTPRRRSREVSGVTMFALPVLFGAVALALLVGESPDPLAHLWVILATSALLAAGARAALTYRENVRMLRLHSRDAITDALTGLGNRRHLMDDLETAVAGDRARECSTLAFFDLNGFKRYNDTFGHAAGDALLTRLGRALSAAVEGHGEAYRLGGDEFCVLLAGRMPRSDALIARAQAALAEHGSGFEVTASCGVVAVPDEADSVSLALSMADERMYADKPQEGSSRYSQTQSVLMQLLSEREPTLRSHVCDVGLLAVAIGREFGLDSEQLDELRRAAELHDIGKLAVPDQILNKPGPLNESEWRLMRRHTLIGERILNAAPALRAVARLVRSSHERWDGDGYPDGIAGEEIPLGARIIAACDSYDAIISDRPYQTSRMPEEAIVELQRHAGSQFDPAVVEALCRHLESPARAFAVSAERALAFEVDGGREPR